MLKIQVSKPDFIWPITHKMGCYPKVECFSGAGKELKPVRVVHINKEQLKIQFRFEEYGYVILTKQ